MVDGLIERSTPYRDAVFAALKRKDLAAFIEVETGNKLVQSGKGWSGWCPLHPGTHSTSFGVYETPSGVWVYHCLGCRQKGTILDFWQTYRAFESVIAAALDLVEKFGLDNDEIINSNLARLRYDYDSDRYLENVHIQAADVCRELWREKPETEPWVQNSYRRINDLLKSSAVERTKTMLAINQIHDEAMRRRCQ